MEIIKINGYGEINILSEYIESVKSAKECILTTSDIKPSEVMNCLKEDKLVIMAGDYTQSCYIMHYIHHYEHELSGGRHNTELKRTRISRICYIAQNNSLVDVNGLSEDIDFRQWIGDDTGDKLYLLPLRKLERIMTDIGRMAEGISYDFLQSKIYIAPFVYVPSDSSVPEMYAKYSDVFKDKSVADMGTGTGILAILAAQSGAKRVVAADINPAAVICSENNAAKSGYTDIIDVVESYLFENINEKFDVILFNAPWVQGNPKNIYELAIYDNHFLILKRFISDAKQYLNNGGIILLQLSDISQQTDGSLDILYNQLELDGFVITESTFIKRKNRMFGKMEKVYLFEIKKRE